MSIGTAIKAATAGITPFVTREFGSVVTIRAVETTRNTPDNEASESWYNAAIGVGCLIHSIDEAKAVRVWGVDSEVTAEGFMALTDEVAPRRAIVVTEGDYAGSAFLIIDTRPSELGQNVLLGLKRVTVAEVENG